MAAIDPEDTKNKLFGSIKKAQEPVAAPKAKRAKNPEAVDTTPGDIPKWKTLDKVTVLLTSEQRDGMEDIARKLMRFRPKLEKVGGERERITANTVFRALVESFLDRVDGLPMDVIQNEAELKAWLSKLFL